MIHTIAELKVCNRLAGHHWFDPAGMRFWGTKIHGGIRGGKYFVSSENNFNKSARLFTVRTFTDDGRITTAGYFQAYPTLTAALKAIEGYCHE